MESAAQSTIMAREDKAPIAISKAMRLAMAALVVMVLAGAGAGAAALLAGVCSKSTRSNPETKLMLRLALAGRAASLAERHQRAQQVAMAPS